MAISNEKERVGVKGLELDDRTSRRTAAAARQARFMARRYAFSLAGAWKPAPTCSAMKNLRLGIVEALGFSSPTPTAISLAPPPPVAIPTSTRSYQLGPLWR